MLEPILHCEFGKLMATELGPIVTDYYLRDSVSCELRFNVVNHCLAFTIRQVGHLKEL